MEKHKILVDNQKCLRCGGCISICSQDAITMCFEKAYVNQDKCIDCGICIKTCPIGAIGSVVN